MNCAPGGRAATSEIAIGGDKQAILPSLEDLGYEIVELDENGQLVES